MRIAFYIFYAFAWLISLLPFWILHGIAYKIYIILYYLIGYRKGVTLDNLRRSFPNKDEKWIKATARKFYLSLAHIILEDIKVLTVSQKKLARHYRYENTELFENIIFYK